MQPLVAVVLNGNAAMAAVHYYYHRLTMSSSTDYQRERSTITNALLQLMFYRKDLFEEILRKSRDAEYVIPSTHIDEMRRYGLMTTAKNTDLTLSIARAGDI